MDNNNIILQILFNVDERNKSTITTNAKKEAIAEILEAWVSSQVGLGKDDSEADKKPEYKIEIQLDLSYDTFSTKSDTGNNGLTCGIIMDLLNRLDNISILGPEEIAG